MSTTAPVMEPVPAGFTQTVATAVPRAAPTVEAPVMQTTGVGVNTMHPERATYQVHQPSTIGQMEVAPPQYVAGASYEEEGNTVTTELHQDQVVAGDSRQQIVEIPTVQEVVEERIIDELQIVEMQQVVQVPKIVPQERVQHRQVEQIVDIPVPMQVEEVVHVPMIVQENRHHHVHVDHHVDIHVPHEREEIVHIPEITVQERVSQQYV